ncbi:hypothetical protein [Rhodoferax sp.]|uniref:hypothetical protein n=1 Tax=Rhodoferax sp. TaxID=50421 RepID=UPI002847C172|nr:hypothetical protein [Rhodoferax sp.]MDR3371062.1 hypothetical protein [Rhodoferax sp.]
MNDFLCLARSNERESNQYVIPEWPEILERQQALETPVWVDEWLKAWPGPISLKQEEDDVDIWPDVFMNQQPAEAPAWQVQWLDWIDSRPLPSSLLKNEPEHLPVVTDRQPDRPSISTLHRGIKGLRHLSRQWCMSRLGKISKPLSA